MRSLIFFLIISTFSLSLFAEDQPRDLTSGETTRYIFGGISTLMIPGGFGIGHYFVGETSKGNLFLLSQGGLVVGSMLLWMSCPHGRSDVVFDPKCEGINKSILDGAAVAFVGLGLYQIFDVWWNGKTYLRKDSEPQGSIEIGPAPGFSITYRF